jgi:nitronate monooxygenase
MKDTPERTGGEGAWMSQIIDGLNELMSAERAGVDTLSCFVQEATDPGMRALFEQVRDDEAWSCAGLAQCIERLGGARTGERGDFVEKVMAVASLTDRLRLLNRGQRWVVKRIERLLARALDESTRGFLVQMASVHAMNIERCDALIGRLDGQREVPASPSGDDEARRFSRSEKEA